MRGSDLDTAGRMAVVDHVAGAATIDTAVTTMSPEPGKTGKVDSPNDPDDGAIDTSGAPNRVDSGVLLEILALWTGRAGGTWVLWLEAPSGPEGLSGPAAKGPLKQVPGDLLYPFIGPVGA